MNKTIKCLAIIDEQSNQSFADEQLITDLAVSRIHLCEESYTVTTLSQLTSRIDGLRVTGLEVSGVHLDSWIELPPCLTHPALPDTRNETCTPELVSKHPHIAHLAKNFPHVEPKLRVLLLIGADCGNAMKTQCHGKTYPFAHETALGWALVGPSCRDTLPKTDTPSSSVLLSQKGVECIDEHVLDTQISPPGLSNIFERRPDDDTLGPSREQIKFDQILNENITQNEQGNLMLPLPLKKGVPLPRNRAAVYMRSEGTLRRVSKDTELTAKCIEIMKEYLVSGQVEQISAEHNEREGKCFIPVFPIKNKKKNNKKRLVFDSSTRHRGTSLNDCLMKGPDIKNRIVGVLTRFRSHTVGFVADI